MTDVARKENQDLMSTFQVEAGDDELLLSKMSLSDKPGSSTTKNALKATISITLGCISALILIQLMCARGVFRMSTLTEDDVIKISTQFRGTDEVDVEQHVLSAVSGNYVMYHVVKPYENTWIIDDFERSLQLLKIETREDSVCYVTHLNRSHSTAPEVYREQLVGDDVVGDRQRVQTTFYADEMQLDDLSKLGTQAVNLCIDTPTFWIYPLSDRASAIDTRPDTHSREKRNVKKCMTSCCTLVCCCNQRYLQWQYEQKFMCHNVCHGCSPLSKTSTIHVC